MVDGDVTGDAAELVAEVAGRPVEAVERAGVATRFGVELLSGAALELVAAGRLATDELDEEGRLVEVDVEALRRDDPLVRADEDRVGDVLRMLLMLPHLKDRARESRRSKDALIDC